MSTQPEDPTPPPLDLGTAGASARREQERRRSNRENRTRGKHPVIGGALLVLRDDPRHERVWATGAAGEEHAARHLAKRLNEAILVLHDRRIPSSRANIDHIAVAPSGVWVIDSKRYKGKVAVQTPLLGKAKLTVGGRDQTKLTFKGFPILYPRQLAKRINERGPLTADGVHAIAAAIAAAIATEFPAA